MAQKQQIDQQQLQQQPVGQIKPTMQPLQQQVLPTLPIQQHLPLQAPQQPPQTARANIFQQLSQSIEVCNNAPQLYKSNVRNLIDGVQTAIHGPPLK